MLKASPWIQHKPWRPGQSSTQRRTQHVSARFKRRSGGSKPFKLLNFCLLKMKLYKYKIPQRGMEEERGRGGNHIKSSS